MNSIRTRYLYDGILFAVAVCIYAPSLWCGFVGDDLIYFIGNKFIKTFDIATILRQGAIGADYLPLRDISFAIDYQIWGENPFGFHLTNVVIYGLTAVSVKYLFVNFNAILIKAEKTVCELPAFMAALIFTLHPTHRDIVYAIFNRGALLTTIFSIFLCLSFITFMQATSRAYYPYIFAMVSFICALMSREYSIIMPFVLVLIICFTEQANKRIAHFIATIPFFITSALFYFTYKRYAIAANYIQQSSETLVTETISKMAVAVKIIVFYIVRMTTFSGKFSQADTVSYTLLSIIIVSAIFVTAIRARRQYPQLLFGFLFYLIGLLPVLNFFNTNPVVAARYSYLPCVGLLFALTALPRSGRLRHVAVFAVIFTSLWFSLTNYKTRYYKNNIVYWENTIPYVKNAFVSTQLGYAYYDGKQYEKAFDTLRYVQPTPMDPRYFDALGNSCFEIGNYPCTIQAFENLMKFDGRRTQAISSLGKTYLQIGDQSNAQKYFEMLSEIPSRGDEKEMHYND